MQYSIKKVEYLQNDVAFWYIRHKRLLKMPTGGGGIDIVDTDNFEGHLPASTNTETSPHKEVLIGGDNNPSRR